MWPQHLSNIYTELYIHIDPVNWWDLVKLLVGPKLPDGAAAQAWARASGLLMDFDEGVARRLGPSTVPNHPQKVLEDWLSTMKVLELKKQIVHG